MDGIEQINVGTVQVTIYKKTKTAYFFSADDDYLGMVWIDHTGAWNVKYAKDESGMNKVGYLPINDVLPHLGYRTDGN